LLILLNALSKITQKSEQKDEPKKRPVFNEVMQRLRQRRKFIQVLLGPLLNSIRGTQMELFYWREGDKEVDFVLQRGKTIVAIEVKSGSESFQNSGMDLFVEKFKPSRVLLIGPQGVPIEDFLKSPLESFL
jgi:predicted AAA+ superfamily ATPase